MKRVRKGRLPVVDWEEIPDIRGFMMLFSWIIECFQKYGKPFVFLKKFKILKKDS